MGRDRLSRLLEFLAQDSTDAFTRFALAQEYARRGELTEARQYYEGLVETTPDYTGTYYHLGELYLQLGDRFKAAEIFRKGMDVAARAGFGRDLEELRGALRRMQEDEE